MYSALDKTKNNPQTERLGVACGQLQLLTGNYCPRKKIVVLMGQRRVRQTAVARGQKHRTRPETTHEFFLGSGSCERLGKTSLTIAEMFPFAWGSIVQWRHHR